jgi:hypothetical protein
LQSNHFQCRHNASGSSDVPGGNSSGEVRRFPRPTKSAA